MCQLLLLLICWQRNSNQRSFGRYKDNREKILPDVWCYHKELASAHRNIGLTMENLMGNISGIEPVLRRAYLFPDMLQFCPFPAHSSPWRRVLVTASPHVSPCFLFPIPISRLPKLDRASHLSSPDEEYNLIRRHWLSNPSWSSSLGAFQAIPSCPRNTLVHSQAATALYSCCLLSRGLCVKQNLVIKEGGNVDSLGLGMRLWDCFKPLEINFWFCKQALSEKHCLLEPASPTTINV